MNLENLSQAVIQGNIKKIKNIIEDKLSQGVEPELILNEGLLKGMKKVGEKYSKQDFCIPEVLLSSRAMHAGMHIITPLIKNESMLNVKVVIGVVAGDLHDVGKNLVVMMLRSRGFEVIDLGIDVSSDKFVEAINKFNPDIVAMSSLLTTTMHIIAETVRKIKSESYYKHTKIMIGGAPVTKEYAEAVSADGYGKDAEEAVQIALKLVNLS
jgi:5-methyltetrahydrofolate--homocysteine methyltransferase